MEIAMHQPPDFPEYATIPDISRRFRLSRSTLYRLIGQGLVEAVKVGSATRIITRSVECYFAKLPRLKDAA